MSWKSSQGHAPMGLQQGGHSSGKPGKVREFESGQGKVRENGKSQGRLKFASACS